MTKPTRNTRLSAEIAAAETLLTHGHGVKLLWLAFLVWLAMDVFGHAAASVIEHLVDPLIGKGGKDLAKSAWHVVAPAALLVGVFFFVRKWIRRQANQGPLAEPGQVRPSRGLILNLSLFNPLKSGLTLADLQEQSARLKPETITDAEHGKLVANLYRTNWGPMAAAILVHDRDSNDDWQPRLEACWILRTSAIDASQSACAIDMISLLARRPIPVELVPVDDANSVAEVMAAVEHIYSHKAPVRSMLPGDVTSDMTGGTAAMSAGMILATLDDSRPVQYLRQPVELLAADGLPKMGDALRAILLPVPTSPKMVARAFIHFLTKGSQLGG